MTYDNGEVKTLGELIEKDNDRQTKQRIANSKAIRKDKWESWLVHEPERTASNSARIRKIQKYIIEKKGGKRRRLRV